MSKSAVSTDGAPKAIGPYSQGVKVGDFLFVSGQIGMNPATMALVASGVETETRQVLANVGAVLAAGGATWDDVVRTTIYLTDLGDFATVNRIYGEVAGDVPPARATVQVAALPRGAVVEIDAIAFVRDR